ncbi:MAG: hypothetical protein AB1530_01765 [Candidatus Omnitrophota bacterium]
MRQGTLHRSGNTLTEAVLVIAIIAILSSCGVYLMLFLLQDAAFIPQKLNIDMMLQDAMDNIVEGDSKARGLRFCKYVVTAEPNQLAFVNQDNQRIQYRLSALTLKLYRSIDGSADALIPYYTNTGMDINGLGDTAFRYYDANESAPANPLEVRRVVVGLEARGRVGTYAGWRCEAAASTSVALKRLQ